MRDARVGKSDINRIGVVTYYLSEAKDVFRLVNEISKALNGTKMKDLNTCVFRYNRSEEVGEVFISVAFEKEDISKGKVKKNCNPLSAGEFDEACFKLISDISEGLDVNLPHFETDKGLYAVDVTGYLDDTNTLSELCLAFLNAKSDIWLNVDVDVDRIAWKPDYIDGKYVFVQASIPSSKGEVNDTKTVGDVILEIS